MKYLVKEAQAMQNELVAWRRTLHQNAEIGMELPKTISFVKGKLEEMGYEPKIVGGSGIVALAKGKKPGKCFLIRADMDALPIPEENNVEYKSCNGNMHACGHDFHTTMLLGAAHLLKSHENDIEGTVKLMFQPGEEIIRGAKAMIEDGVLENPKVDAAAMIHVAVGYPINSGVIIVPKKGAFSFASDWFEISIHGKGGHGATPEDTIDPLNVMSHLHIALQAINSREISSSDTAVVTVGVMQGGDASNVIPDTAFMKGTIRTYNEKVREFIIERIKCMSTHMAETFRATANPVIIQGCPCVVIDENVSNCIHESLMDVFGPKIIIDPKFSMTHIAGSEDFSFITEKIPGLMIMLSAGSIDEGHVFSVHHPKVTFNEAVLSQGAAVYAITAMSWLAKNK